MSNLYQFQDTVDTNQNSGKPFNVKTKGPKDYGLDFDKESIDMLLDDLKEALKKQYNL